MARQDPAHASRPARQSLRDLAADADGGAIMNLPLQPSVQLDRQLEVSTRSNPLWFKNALVYEAHVKAFHDSNNDGIGDFEGMRAKAGLSPGSRHHRALAAAVLSVAAQGRRLRHRQVSRHPSRPTARCATSAAGARLPRSRHPGHHRAGHQPHVRPASLVPARPPRQAGLGGARFLCLERHRPEVQGLPASSSPIRRSRTGPGTRSPRPIIGTASTRTSLTSISTIPSCWKRSSASCGSGSTPASTDCGWTPSPISSSAKARTARTCPRPTT